MPHDSLVQRANELTRALSRTPRFAGSADESEARTFCVKELERAGLQCVERPFNYSQWPGKWGIPTAAAAQLATILIVSRIAMMTGPLIALLIGAALSIALISASADAKRRWVQVFPFLRSSSVNLEARRGHPKVWLVAHLDSKSQTVPMLIRVASSIALGLVALAATVLLLVSLIGFADPRPLWVAIQVAAVAAAIPSVFCLVRNESPGAVDNATGIAAVLLAATSLSSLPNLGVLITSAEELGLAGARVWAQTASFRSIVLNCDTIDGTGGWRLMYTGPRPRQIVAATETIAPSLTIDLRVTRMIPGILADSMAFADRGIQAITLSRGTTSTLARIHTRRDNSMALSGGGVAEASTVLADLTRKLS